MCVDKDKMKLEFISIVSKVLLKLDKKYKEYILNKRLTTGKHYYEDQYWYCLKLKPKKDKSENTDYENVVAIHIKPYRINNEDVKRAENGKKKNRIVDYFYKNNEDFVDYDINSANFHKNTTKMEPQVVLVAEGTSPQGPDWKDSPIKNKDGKTVLELEVKTKWYFPRLDEGPSDKTDKVEELKALISRAIKEIYNITESEQK